MRRLLFYLIAFVLSTSDLYALPNLSQSEYRWRNDDGDETSATWVGGPNTSTIMTANDVKRLRLQLFNSGSAGATINQKLEYSSNGGASWSTMNNNATDTFLYLTSTWVSDGTPTTAQSTSPAAGTFVAGKVVSVPGTSQTLNGSERTEYEWVIGPNPAVPPLTTTYIFRASGLTTQPTVYPALNYVVSATGCYGAGNLTATNINTTDAELGWTEFGPATQWEVEYGIGNSFALGTGAREIANTNPYTLGITTPLHPSTSYTYFIRSICGPNDTSAWSVRSPLFSTIATCDTPDNSYASNILVNSADLNWVDNNGASLWEVIYGPAPLNSLTADTIAATFYPLSLTGLLSGTVYEYSIRAVCVVGSDSSVAATGSFGTPPGCGDSFYDSGGPSGVYTNNENDTTTIYPVNPGDQVTVTFSSFYTESGYDYLYVYDGPDVTYPLLGTFDGNLTGSALPGAALPGGAFTSSDASGALTFRFHSDGSGTYDGWEASVTCASPPTCLAATTLAASNITSTSADLSWIDNNGATLWEVEYGPAPLTAGTGTVDYTSSNPYSILSGLIPGTDYQYNVRAICGAGDTSSRSSSYFKTLPGCGGNFYDSGGLSGVYSNNENDTTTIYPINPGDQVTVTFSSFYTESGYDYLYVYDGPDVTYPLLGTFDGNLTGSALPGAALPGGAFTSSDVSGALTFRFHSDGSGTYAGWEAAVTCAPPPNCLAPTTLTASNITTASADLDWIDNNGATLWEVEYGPAPLTAGTGTVDYTPSNPYSILSGLIPGTSYQFNVRTICGVGDTSGISSGYFKTPPGCGGNFYDSGGSSGTYTNYEDDTTTIYPNNPGDQVTVTFSSFYTESGYDYLYVYDGPDVTYPLLGTFDGNLTGSNLPGPFTSSDPSGALTFRFHSDVSNTYDGWAASVTCAPIPTCPKPVALATANATTSGIDLNWTSSGAQAQVEYGVGNFVLGTGTRTPVFTNTGTYSLSSVTYDTSFTFYVRDVCGANDTSAWSSAKVFYLIPSNDDCANAVDITDQTTKLGTTGGATQTMAPCNTQTLIANDVWYSFNTATAGSVTITAVSNVADLVLEVFSGACGSLTTLTATSTNSSPTASGSSTCVDGPAAGTESATYSVAANSTYYVRLFGYDASEGTFTINATGAPLAIKLDKLSAANVGASNRIEWNTFAEERSDKFELERSIDGKTFAKIYEKQANGEPSRYTYMDNNPVKGYNYYRLRMAEANGNATYSEVVKAFVKSSGFEVDAYPNPVSHDLTVKVSGIQGTDAILQVTDVTGKVIRTIKMAGNVEQINMSGLANGIYLIKYSDANHTQTIKVNKQ